MTENKRKLLILPENVTAEEFQKFEYQHIPVLEHTAYNPTSHEFYVLETQTNKNYDSFIFKSEMFSDPGTVIFKNIDPIYASLHVLLKSTEKFIPYDQLPKPWNNLDLIQKVHTKHPKVLELKKIELDEDDILHTVKLNVDNLLDFLTEKLNKIADNRKIVGKYASEPKFSALQVLKEFLPVEITKMLSEKLNIPLVKVKAQVEEKHEADSENVEPEKKKVKIEAKKISRTEKELAKIDKKGMKKMTSFFKVVSKKK